MLDDDDDDAFEFDGIEEIIGNVKTPCWTVRDYIESDTHMLLFGESETLKSFIAVDLGLHVATGKDWCGQPVKQGTVFYINGEGRGGFNRRVKAWCIANKITEVVNIPFFRSRKPTRFYDEGAAVKVALAIKKLSALHGNPVMVIIDTLAKNLGADENSNQDIGQYVRHVDDLITRPYGCSVITIHHVGHGDKTRARGAYALKGDFDADMMVMRDKSSLDDVMTLEPGKMKDAPTGDPLSFNPRVVELGLQDEWGRKVTSLVLKQTDYVEPRKQGGIGKAQGVALDVLKAMQEEKRKNLNGGGYDPEQARIETIEWRTRLEEEEVNGKPLLGNYPRQRFKTIRDSLLLKRHIRIEGCHVYHREA